MKLPPDNIQTLKSYIEKNFYEKRDTEILKSSD